jgi:predicted RNA binding protein YcfA (HicA-like mRNA interferase family)
MTAKELLKMLKALGATVNPSRGKGGHVQVILNGRVTFVPLHAGDIKKGTLHAICKQLGVTENDL